MKLSDQQVSVLSCAARGWSIADTAVELGVSEHTVSYHRRMAIAILGANTLTHACFIAAAKGLFVFAE